MLATVPQLASYLNVTGDDERLATLLIEAEAALEAKYGLPEVSPTEDATRSYIVDGPTVYPRDCMEVTGLTDADGNALSYTVVGGPRSTDPIRWVTLSGPFCGLVEVTGTFGLLAVPASVSRAIVVTAAAWYRRQTVGAEGNYIGGLSAIPKEADDLMRSWRGWS